MHALEKKKEKHRKCQLQTSTVCNCYKNQEEHLRVKKKLEDLTHWKKWVPRTLQKKY